MSEDFCPVCKENMTYTAPGIFDAGCFRDAEMMYIHCEDCCDGISCCAMCDDDMPDHPCDEHEERVLTVISRPELLDHRVTDLKTYLKLMQTK